MFTTVSIALIASVIQNCISQSALRCMQDVPEKKAGLLMFVVVAERVTCCLYRSQKKNNHFADRNVLPL